MTTPTQQSSQARNYVFDTIQGIIVVAIIAIALQWDTIVALTLSLLVGVWILDAVIKKTLGFSNETIFADLSFLSFTFVIGRIIETIRSNITHIKTNNFIQIAIIAFILGFIWYANLSTCRGITDINSKSKVMFKAFNKDVKQEHLSWFISLVFSLISASIAVYMQFFSLT